MNPKRVIFLVVVLSVVLSLVWQTVTTVPESPIATLVRQLDAADASTRQFAAAKLAELGDQAVSELLAMLNPVEPSRIVWLRRQLPPELLPPPPCTRAQVLRALELLGPQAEAAIPQMLTLLDGRHSPQRPANILVAIGAPVVLPLCRALNATTNEELQVQLIHILAQMGTNATAAAPELFARVATAQPEVRAAVTSALWKIRAAPAAAIPELQKLLHDESPGVRQQAADGLGEYGPPAAAATLELLEATQDPVAAVRLAALRAVLKLEDARAAEIALRQFADDPDPLNRAAARSLQSNHATPPRKD